MFNEKEYMKKYRLLHKKEINKNSRKYNHSEKGKLAHKEAQKRYNITEKGKLHYRKDNKNWRQKHLRKASVESRLDYYFKKYIDRNDFICALCGKQPTENHHENYDLWNSFIPLCKKHHMEIHYEK